MKIQAKLVKFVKDAGETGVRNCDIIKYYVTELKKICSPKDYKSSDYRGMLTYYLYSWDAKNYVTGGTVRMRTAILEKYCVKVGKRYVHKDNVK